MRHILYTKKSKRPSSLVLAVCLTSLFALSHPITALAQATTGTTATTAPIQDSLGELKKTPAKKVAKSELINSIAVVVNNEAITKIEVDMRVAFAEKSLKGQGITLPPREDIEKRVVEQMILDRLQIQMAKEQGMYIDDVMLDRSIQRMAEQAKMSVNDMRNQIEREGTPFVQFREEIRDDIMRQKIREREVDSKIQVSELEVDNFLAAQELAPSKNQELNIGHIMIAIPENATPDVIAKRNARAQEAYKRLRVGEDFAKLAASYSESAEALKGGEVGWRLQDTIPPLFMDALAKVQNVGGFTEIIRSPSGFHILKLLGKRDAAPVAAAEAIQETKVRHILMRPTQLLSAAQIKTKLLELKQSILNKSATFEDLAKTNSIDSSAAKGGDLGWVRAGDTFPEFESVMGKLEIGAVSDPVETQLGFHLIQVVERSKVSDDSKEKKRVEARNAVRARKSDEAEQDWKRQLRDSAYVEFRTEQK